MEKEKTKVCESCGKEVPERNLDRYGECSWCRAEDKRTEMTVGDLNRR